MPDLWENTQIAFCSEVNELGEGFLQTSLNLSTLAQ